MIERTPTGQVDLAVVEYTDPLCVWAWSSESKFERLRQELRGRATWRRVVGILVDPAGGVTPLSAAEQLARWAETTAHTGAPLPEVLERAPASSWPAAYAIKAAARQQLEDVVVGRLRRAVFVGGVPPDNEAAIRAALAGVRGLDLERLLTESQSDEVRREALADWDETRHPHPSVIGLTEPLPHPGAAAPDGDRLRYRFPTILFRGADKTIVVPGWRPYEDYAAAAAEVVGAGAMTAP